MDGAVGRLMHILLLDVFMGSHSGWFVGILADWGGRGDGGRERLHCVYAFCGRICTATWSEYDGAVYSNTAASDPP